MVSGLFYCNIITAGRILRMDYGLLCYGVSLGLGYFSVWRDGEHQLSNKLYLSRVIQDVPRSI